MSKRKRDTPRETKSRGDETLPLLKAALAIPQYYRGVKDSKRKLKEYLESQGQEKLADKITTKKIKQLHDEIPANQIFRKEKYKTKYKFMHRITAPKVGYLQADLLDISKFAGHNHRFSFILVVIDVYSRYVWAEPLTTKTASIIEKEMEHIFQQVKAFHEKPTTLTTDQGKEFENKGMSKLCKDWHVTQFFDPGPPDRNAATASSHTYTAIVERVNRTIRTALTKAMWNAGDLEWKNKLKKVIDDYNNSIHTSTGRKPIEIIDLKKKPVKKIEEKQEAKKWDKNLVIGDYVRYAVAKKKFGKSHDPVWSEKIHWIVGIDGYKFYLNDMDKPFTQFQLTKTGYSPETEKKLKQTYQRITGNQTNKEITEKKQPSITEMQKELEAKASKTRFLRKEGIHDEVKSYEEKEEKLAQRRTTRSKTKAIEESTRRTRSRK